MEAIHQFSDYGNIIIEIDKLVRSDRDKLYGNTWTSDSNRVPTGSGHVPKHAPSPKPQTSTDISSTRNSVQHKPVIQLTGTTGINGTLSSLIGEPETGVECAAPKDMRQVRLFKTRFCSYGSDCPYMLRGKCLYAHNRDEIRFRPPPPTGYNAPTKPSTKTSPTLSPKASDGSPTKSVWALPENSPSDYGDVSSQANVVPSYSLFDFMPPRTSTTNINYSEFPSL